MPSSESTTPVRKTDSKRFTLVYATSKKPSTRHADERCWSSTSYRQATPEEMESLPICKHCAKRVETDAQKAREGEKPKREPIPAKTATAPKTAEPQAVMV